MKRNDAWKEEEDVLLTRLWNVEKLSAGQITKEIKRTRNAIIGRASRLGLDMRHKGGSKKGTRKAVKAFTPVYKRPPSPPRPPRDPKKPGRPFIIHPYRAAERKAPQPVAPIQRWTGEGVHILEATHGQCRAILGSSDDPHRLAICCGKPVKEGSNFSFCDEHLALYTTNPWR